MTDWGAFAGFAGVVLAGLLLLAHVSQHAISDGDSDDAGSTDPVDGAGDDSEKTSARTTPRRPSTSASSGTETPAYGQPDDDAARANGGEAADARGGGTPAEAEVGHATVTPARRQLRGAGPADVSTTALLLNVAFSQGLFGGLLALGAWYTGVPLAALGLDPAVTPVALLVGSALGVALYVANQVGAAVGERFDLGGSEALRAALAPDSARGWALLLLGVLPVIAAFEEFLFRGVLVGALAVGFGLSPWVLAGVSSVAFAVGHGAQGPAGIAVTGVVGFVLAVAFVFTGSLVAVAVAHYLVNALEFVVHEGFDVEWRGRGGEGVGR